MSQIELPKGWLDTKLESLCTKPQYGYTTKASEQGLVKFLRTTDITKGALNWETVPFCEIPPDSVEKYQLRNRDIVISRAGSIGFSSLLIDPPLNAVFASYLIRFEPSTYISERYLKRYLESPFYWDQLNAMSAGNALQNVNAQKLSDLDVPVPPLAEQKVIADKLDTLLAQVESIKARLERIPEILKQFRQSVLAAAVSGKLTEEWRETRPASDIAEMLSNIVKARESVMIGNQKRGIDFTVDEHLKPHVQLPRGWDTVGLGNLIEFLSDYHANGSYEVLKKHVVLKEQKDYACMIRATNFEKGNFDDLMIYIDEDAYNFLSKTKLYGNEILISKIGNAGSVYFMPKLDRPCSLAMNLFMLRFNENLVHSKYIYYFLISSYGEKAIQQYVRGVATKSIDKKSVRNIFIYLPSFDEQLEIVKKIEKYFDLIDAVESQVKNSLEKVNNLTQSILSKAFRGELTAEWREANPELISGENSAEALLERIKAERSAKSVTKPGRGKA